VQHGASPPDFHLDGKTVSNQPCSTGSSCPFTSAVDMAGKPGPGV